MERQLLKAGLSAGKKQSEELKRLKEKVNTQAAMINNLTSKLASVEAGAGRRDQEEEGGGGGAVPAAVAAELQALRAENARLKRERTNLGLGGALGGIMTRSPTGSADTRAGLSQLNPSSQKDLWKAFRKKSLQADVLSGSSQAHRFVNATNLAADIQDAPVSTFIDDELYNPDGRDAQKHRRTLHGVLLWAQCGRYDDK